MKEEYVLKADAAKHLTPEPITYEAMKRKSEKAAQTALKDAKASILNAAGIGKVEAYCINTVLAELKRKGLSPEQEEYKLHQQRDGQNGHQGPERNLDKILYRQGRSERLASLETGSEERDSF